jgi:glycosyltransferase involved in cell wall biosynthesis
MKVVQLLPELNEGGVERGVVELNREFVRHGVDSVVISRGGTLAEQIIRDSGQHVEFDVCSKNPLTIPSRVAGLRRLLASLAPDIIHARSRVPAWLCLLANRKLQIPFVTTVHGMNSVSPYSRVMTRGDRVICVSEVVRDYIQKHYSVDESRVSVIQRGVDMDLFNPDSTDQEFMQAFRQRFGLENRFVVTSVGRITWLKDYESFIRAIARCRESIPDIAGVIVGGVREDKHKYLEGLQRLASESGVADCVIFTGGQTRMPEIYQLSDVVVNASLKMGNVGRTVTEALAMNTPVIATTFEGLRNLVEDGLNGYIVTNQDPDGLADCILRLYRAPLTATRASIPQEFTLEAMVADTLAVYRSLTGEHADVTGVV